MKTLKLLLFFLLFFSIQSHATHIVGGEVRLVYLAGGVGESYKIILNLYFDNINGNPAAEDQSINVGIYSKASRQRVDYFTLTKESQNNIAYLGDICQTGSLSTRIIVYSREVQLNPAIYTSANGYFMVWERCCRNNVITNVSNPNEASNSFYSEFPATRQGGAIFRNSAPNLGIPPGDYLCINQPVFVNFGGTDPDGDVLQYSLTTPYDATIASRTNPKPFEGPAPGSGQLIPPPTYSSAIPSLVFLPGYSAAAPILSNTPGGQLSINPNTGLLSVNPNTAGLFVFSVVCMEYRGGVKIGEVRRDFQFLVKNCPPNSPPTLTLNTPQNQPYVTGNDMIIDLQVNDPLCFSLNIQDTPNDIIRQITLIPAAGSESFVAADYTVSANTVSLGPSGISNGVTICWERCRVNSSSTGRFIFDVEIRDNGCPNVGIARQRVILYVKGKGNIRPKISIVGNSGNFNVPTLIGDVLVGDSLFIDLKGIDLDSNDVSFSAEGVGFNFTPYGGKFTTTPGKGMATARFSIKANCNNIKRNGQSDTLLFKFTLKEANGANCVALRDSIQVKIRIKDETVDLSTFTPYNVFTPDGDTKNAYYALDNLPKDNCVYNFRDFTVYNRWGKRVYETKDKNFRWDGKNFPAGLYYYYLDYNQKKYKGSISILY